MTERVQDCLLPKGWQLMTTHVKDEVELRVFTREGEAAEVGVVSTGAGGIFRDSLLVRVDRRT